MDMAQVGEEASGYVALISGQVLPGSADSTRLDLVVSALLAAYLAYRALETFQRWLENAAVRQKRIIEADRQLQNRLRLEQAIEQKQRELKQLEWKRLERKQRQERLAQEMGSIEI
jgi:dsRNA-specific ribonuclease